MPLPRIHRSVLAAKFMVMSQVLTGSNVPAGNAANAYYFIPAMAAFGFLIEPGLCVRSRRHRLF